MSSTTNRNATLPVVALACGVLGDHLLRAWPPGLGSALWLAVVAGAAVSLSLVFGSPLRRPTLWLLGLAVLFGATLAWRDSPTLELLSAGSAALTLLLAGASTARFRLFSTGFLECLRAATRAAGKVIASPFVLVLENVRRIGGLDRRSVRVGTACLRGVLIAIPILIIFGYLLGSADVMFRNLALDLFDVDLGRVASHVGLTVLGGAAAAGLLVLLLDGPTLAHPAAAGPTRPRSGEIEVNVVLGLVDLLFAGFVAVQFTYLFGGSERIRSVPDLTYAEYARQGFFELVAVAALCLPLLLLLDWVLRAAGGLGRQVFRGLAGVQIALLLVVLSSAFVRMDAYRQAYGLTELRLYVTVFLIWLAIVLLWCGATVLTGRREVFLSGVFVSGALAVLALHTVNPDAFIAQVNVDRLDEGMEFDAAYATTLSGDAAPVLAAALEKLSPADRELIRRHLVGAWGGDEDDDWRGLSWGRSLAREAVRSMLLADEAPEPQFDK